MSDYIQDLARRIDALPDRDPESQAVSAQLRTLLSALNDGDLRKPNVLIERIRDVSDRIQQPAGQRVRRLQQKSSVPQPRQEV